MPKGRFPKLKESICNILIDSNDAENVLPQGADSNGLLFAKLKRKLNHRGHVYFEAASPEIIHQTLMYLKQSNSLYHDIDIALDNVPRYLLSLTDNTNDQDSDSAHLLEEGVNLLDLQRCNSEETMFISDVLETEEIHIAPGEGK